MATISGVDSRVRGLVEAQHPRRRGTHLFEAATASKAECDGIILGQQSVKSVFERVHAVENLEEIGHVLEHPGMSCEVECAKWCRREFVQLLG